MQNQAIYVDFAQHRKTKTVVKKKKAKPNGKGSIYARSNKLWVDFRYLGERVREPSGLSDTTSNKKTLRKQLDLIIAEIDNGVFEFSKRFPYSKKKELFAELEGKTILKEPQDVLFKVYSETWFQAMQPGMSESQIRDYKCILNMHLLPYFAELSIADINTVKVKKFVALLKGKKSHLGTPLSARRIQNIMIPLRVIVRDCIDEHGWTTVPDPFRRCKLPRPQKYRVQPFNFEQWEHLMKHMPELYKPYFEFAVHTGLRPSEQIALKWDSIDDDFIYIEQSRYRGKERDSLKTHGSKRMINLRRSLVKILERQKHLTEHLNTPYVFTNNNGNPIDQCTVRKIWKRALKRAGMTPRRMYETRHTFASWALALGETPEWVARTLGHVDTSMVYRTYGRYIPNLTKLDGSAFEKQLKVLENKKGN